ncbi:hypothetical protein D3C84_1054260 [compost metagenome]
MKGKHNKTLSKIRKALFISTSTCPSLLTILPVKTQNAPFPISEDIILNVLSLIMPRNDLSVIFEVKLSDSSVLLFKRSRVSVCSPIILKV